MATYDKHYKKEEYFGNPYEGMLDYFTKQERGELIDLGAGQGRDSIPLNKMGYDVTAVDISKVGLNQIKEKANNIKTVLADIYTYNIEPFDYILLDSMLHFYKGDIEKEKNLVENIISKMKNGAVFANCMLKSKKAEKYLMDIVKENIDSLEILKNDYVEYKEVNAKYNFLVIKKK